MAISSIQMCIKRLYSFCTGSVYYGDYGGDRRCHMADNEERSHTIEVGYTEYINNTIELLVIN